jgi:V/A-type H+-transporting ATPase subunit B
MNAGVGASSTREDHRGIADQASALLGRGHELRRLISIVGERALSDDDRRTLTFVDQFERRFVGQGTERRSIEQTLDLAWQLLAPIPVTELRRVPTALIERYHAPTPCQHGVDHEPTLQQPLVS